MISYVKRSGLSPWHLILSGLGIVGGIWLILAPFVLNYANATSFDAVTKKPISVDLTVATNSDISCGVILIALVVFMLLTVNNEKLAKVRINVGIEIILLGVYLMAAPYLFEMLKVGVRLDGPSLNDQLIGSLIILLGGFAFQNRLVASSNITGLAHAVRG